MNEIAHLIARPWLMDERMAAIMYAQYMGGRLNLTTLKTNAQQKNAAVYGGMGASIGTHSPAYKVKTKSGKNVAVMPVVGTLTKRGEMCSYGMKDYINEIAALNANEEISAIVMDMEGPGGTVDGTPEFGLAVKQSKKPVVTFGDYMVASANYWVASQSKYIIGNKNNPTEFGSIGVLCVHEYWGKFIEENIGEIKIIRAPQSTDKTLVNPIEQLTPELEEAIKEDLRSLAKDFHATVKKGRGNKLTASEKDWGTGKMYKSAEAVELGLIDAVGTLMSAVDKAAELASAGSLGTTKGGLKANTNMTMKDVKRKVSSFFNKKSAAAKAAEAPTPAAAEDATPMWTEEMTFNTDGSGDGAFCLHADDAGTDRKFETKIDNNKGNQPPTDPAITEDDNWAQVQEATEEVPADGAGEGEGAEPLPGATIVKLNAEVKKARAEAKAFQAQLATMQAKVKALEDEKAKNENKPAAPATTVVGKQDPQGKRTATTSWEKKAARKVGADVE